MTNYTSDDQWRSFQTFIATYLAGMLHPRDVFTISRTSSVMAPLAEFRCDAAGQVWFGMGAKSWSDEDGASIQVSRDQANQVAAQTVQVLRNFADLDDPRDLRLSGSGPASSVAVLAKAGFMNGDYDEPAREAAMRARMTADIDTEGDTIDAEARAAGQRAFEGTRNGNIAAVAFAAALAGLRSWVDPFSPTPKTGYLVGGGAPREAGD
ncbi:hypothetical protein [[Mycobacterium] nativiensis]|uniref:Uncharacterized protein n=1 Tax=[Mycobacterium] nativiensis TaxID=2855503 RepID=A0ABU5XZG3_9MYCO|nr:hypothetical protein [Mycolicibacter sp. MYC340]MEB3032075.1 hypothetical protein [Mycolicibacter sp. MYC340]